MRVAECIKYSQTLTSLPDDNRRMDRIGWMRPSFFLPASSPLFRIQIPPGPPPHFGIHNGAIDRCCEAVMARIMFPLFHEKINLILPLGITRDPTLIRTRSSENTFSDIALHVLGRSLRRLKQSRCTLQPNLSPPLLPIPIPFPSHVSLYRVAAVNMEERCLRVPNPSLIKSKGRNAARPHGLTSRCRGGGRCQQTSSIFRRN